MTKKIYVLVFAAVFIIKCGTPDINDISSLHAEYDIDFKLNIVYTSSVDADKGQLDLKMDVYYPINDSTEKRPLLIMIHGGSFMRGFGGKESCGNWARIMAEKGYTVACIDYRLWRGIKSVYRAIKAAIFDARAAVRYFKANAEDWSIDPDHILIGGYSAGASVALYVAYYPELSGNDNFTNIDYSEDVFAVFSVSGSWGPGQSSMYMDKREPPIIIFHGTGDMVVSVREAYATRTTADEMGIYAESYIYKRAKHNLLDIKINEICMRIDQFYKRISAKE